MVANAAPLEPWRALRHPLWWMALVLLLANDHVPTGAGLLPAALTGKLSDVAGLVVAPALLATILGARRTGSASARKARSSRLSASSSPSNIQPYG